MEYKKFNGFDTTIFVGDCVFDNTCAVCGVLLVVDTEGDNAVLLDRNMKRQTIPQKDIIRIGKHIRNFEGLTQRTIKRIFRKAEHRFFNLGFPACQTYYPEYLK